MFYRIPTLDDDCNFRPSKTTKQTNIWELVSHWMFIFTNQRCM